MKTDDEIRERIKETKQLIEDFTTSDSYLTIAQSSGEINALEWVLE